MHEMSLMENILNAATAALQPYAVTQVRSLEVEAGILANILPDAFDFAFEALSANTIFAGAQLVVHKKGLKARCLACSAVYESMTVPPVCPLCASRQVEIQGGTEVLLTAIDFDQEDEG